MCHLLFPPLPTSRFYIIARLYYLCSAIIDPGSTLTPIAGIERGVGQAGSTLLGERQMIMVAKVWKASGTSVPVCSMVSIQDLPICHRHFI
ncbi:hypothetical protein BGZ61DRAFT_464824 [Ilyonectria robusta]|uniref:uncharacterized protein n=1 Tax=Ilyonectria robusta TaxID=1079257 RepID=UPI001E8DA633|nr:uncharacterized protein BGZ61DRAFT_464824 [Ilyonectria robusta]KAH8659667.1 hypothetical protein BGZ61DRAFT_464824 [Ilyonectria robusta]